MVSTRSGRAHTRRTPLASSTPTGGFSTPDANDPTSSPRTPQRGARRDSTYWDSATQADPRAATGGGNPPSTGNSGAAGNTSSDPAPPGAGRRGRPARRRQTGASRASASNSTRANIGTGIPTATTDGASASTSSTSGTSQPSSSATNSTLGSNVVGNASQQNSGVDAQSDIQALQATYLQIASYLNELLSADTSVSSSVHLQRHIQLIRKTMKQCDEKFNILLNAGVPVEFRHHQDLLQDAADIVEILAARIPLNLRSESGEEFRSTMPSEIYNVEFDTLNTTRSAMTLTATCPAGFLDNPRPWDPSMATAVAQLETSPIPKFSGESNSITWPTFWSQWKQRVHDLPEEALSIAVKFDKLVKCLTGTAATFTAGLSKVDAASAYKMLVGRLHGNFHRIPINPERIIRRLQKLELTDNSVDATCEWIGSIQSIALELVQAGRDAEEAHRTCYNHLYNGLSESVRGQIDIMLSSNPTYVSYADKFNACATFLWVKLINLKNREEQPKKKLLSFEQAEKTLLNQQSGNGKGHRGKKPYPTRDQFPSDHEFEKFMKKYMQDKNANPNTSLETVLHAYMTSSKAKSTGKGCPFHKMDPKTVQHSAAECRIPVKYRTANAITNKYCTVCLRNNHTTSNCKSKQSCSQCDERHSQFLCPKVSPKRGVQKGQKKTPFTGGKKKKRGFKKSKPFSKQYPKPNTDVTAPAAQPILQVEARPTLTSALKQDPSEME